MKTVFEVGDIVCYRSSFLRSIGWYTDVPINGRVVSAQHGACPGCEGFPKVQWCDRDDAIAVNPANLILYNERHLESA
jgi:hypothetical protein